MTITHQAAAWEAADPVLGRTLAEAARAAPQADRQVRCELLVLLTQHRAVAEAGGRLTRQLPAALPQVLLSLRPQVDPHVVDFLSGTSAELRPLMRADAVAAFFSLLEHPASLSDESIALAARAIDTLCGTRDPQWRTVVRSEFTATEESRLLALLDSPHPRLRRAVADTLAARLEWTLACPNPGYEARPTGDAVQRYERWVGELTRRATDPAIVPALVKTARANRDHRLLPLLRELSRTAPEDVRAAAVAALVELGGAADAEPWFQNGSPEVQRAALSALSASRLRALLRDPSRPLELRVHALEQLAEMRELEGR